MRKLETSSMVDSEVLDVFSKTLYEVYRLAKEEPLERFIETMLECVQSLISFKSAWWGRGSQSLPSVEYMHSCYFHNLPADYFESWRAIKDEDDVLYETHKHIGKAVVFDFTVDPVSKELKGLGKGYGFNKLMCVHYEDEITGLGTHLSLYRDKYAPNFSVLEQQFFQALMPHLHSATSINQIRNYQQLFSSQNPHQIMLATCDKEGVLQSAEPALAELLMLEYPDWRGPKLPFIPTTDNIHGKHLIIDIQDKGEQFLLAARPICAIEQLSGREQEVAVRFGNGATYKEIAQDLGVSPHTVRYYLRSIYTKLGAHNKADISRLLSDLPRSNH